MEEEEDEHSVLSQVERRSDIAQLFDLSEERISAMLLGTQVCNVLVRAMS